MKTSLGVLGLFKWFDVYRLQWHLKVLRFVGASLESPNEVLGKADGLHQTSMGFPLLVPCSNAHEGLEVCNQVLIPAMGF